jgi:hypothetical protein
MPSFRPERSFPERSGRLAADAEDPEETLSPAPEDEEDVTASLLADADAEAEEAAEEEELPDEEDPPEPHAASERAIAPQITSVVNFLNFIAFSFVLSCVIDQGSL